MSSFYKEGATSALTRLGLQPAEENHTGLATTLGTGATLGLYALLRRQRLAANPVLRAIQQASKGKLTTIDYSSRSPALEQLFGKVHPQNWMPDALRSMAIRLGRGVDEVRLRPLHKADIPLRQKHLEHVYTTGRVPKRGLNTEHVEGAVITQGEPYLGIHYRGDVNPAGNIADALRIGSDKLREARLLHKHMPGIGPKPYGTVANYVKQTKTPLELKQQLQHIQQTLRHKYPEGFIVKPRTAAATGDIITNTDDLLQLLQQKGPKQKWLREMVQQPSAYVVQERLPLATEKRIPFLGRKYHTGRKELPVEYRVHTVGGRIVPQATIRRYPTLGNLNPFRTWREKREIVKQLQPQLDRLPTRYRQQMMMALDVAKTRDGTFRLIETNPIGAQSGFLMPDTTHIPTLAPHHIYRTITGRESKPFAAVKAVIGGGATAGATAGTTAAVSAYTS